MAVSPLAACRAESVPMALILKYRSVIQLRKPATALLTVRVVRHTNVAQHVARCSLGYPNGQRTDVSVLADLPRGPRQPEGPE